jgi:hypothetical protein
MEYKQLKITKNSNFNVEIIVPGTDRYSKICASLNPAPFEDEIIIGIKDKNGLYDQDLVLVRRNVKTKKYEVLVWSDANSEDYTHLFEIDRYVSDEDNAEEQSESTESNESDDADDVGDADNAGEPTDSVNDSCENT